MPRTINSDQSESQNSFGEREAAASAAAALNCKQLESRKTEKKFRGLILLISFEKMIVYFFVLFEQTSEKSFRCFVAKIFFGEKTCSKSTFAFLSPCSIIRPLARLFPKKELKFFRPWCGDLFLAAGIVGGGLEKVNFVQRCLTKFVR